MTSREKETQSKGDRYKMEAKMSSFSLPFGPGEKSRLFSKSSF
jgi:hypothetical protein